MKIILAFVSRGSYLQKSSVSVKFRETGERKKKKEKRPLRDAGSIYIDDIILIPCTCRHPKPCRQGQCHCHSETVKVWSFCASALPTRIRMQTRTHARTAHASTFHDSLILNVASLDKTLFKQRE